MAAHLKPPVTEKDHVEGKPSAAIELVEFGDYQCPHCGAAYPIIKKVQQTFGSQLRFVFRNFPLAEIHPYAVAAALSAEAAALQGKFWAMHDALFENQQGLNEDKLLQLAGSVGLDIAAYKDALSQNALQTKVDADFESGVRSGVNGTPSFFINGIKFDGGAADLFSMLKQNAG